jgi:hypothetical protein
MFEGISLILTLLIPLAAAVLIPAVVVWHVLRKNSQK